jgi:hypothetical protein
MSPDIVSWAEILALGLDADTLQELRRAADHVGLGGEQCLDRSRLADLLGWMTDGRQW